MKKINFKNLPDISTPLSAGNMNLLQSNIEESTVEVSATQPTNKQAVWLKSSRNLFDKTKVESNKGISASDGKTFDTTSQNATDYIYVKGQEYISSNCISSPSGGTGQYYGAFYDSSKKYVAPAESKNSISLKIPSNAVYLRLTLKKELMNSLMINFGKELLDYEPYVDKEILTFNGTAYDKFSVVNSGSNSNGSYVKFSDGTMICHDEKSVEILRSRNTPPLTTYQKLGTVCTFAKEFVGVPNVIPSFTSSDLHAWLGEVRNGFQSAGNTEIDQIVVYAIEDSPSVTLQFRYIAIGRWK